jgi:putative CocE/NonD family hydrolase
MTEKVSRPFEYRGYTKKLFSGLERSSVYVEMSDGARIATDFYLPRDYTGSGETPKKFPVIFYFTPYRRAVIDPVSGEIRSLVREVVMHDYHEYGYALVLADTRGYGASTGNGMSLGHRYQQDTGEMVDWIAAQEWCDGNIGMLGGSHNGWTQLSAAAQRPKALKAIVPAVVPFEGATGQFFPGGILMYSFVTGDGVSVEIGANWDERLKLTVAPVDGRDAFTGAKAEANVRDGLEDDLMPTFNWEERPYLDARAPTGESAKDLCANLIPKIAGSDVAIYNFGAWFDGFARATTEIYCTLAPTNPSRLAMFPGFHMVNAGFVYDALGVDVPDLVTERRRFFDRYLKGIENGIDQEPPVLIFNINGDGWRQEKEWPLAREEAKDLYLSSEHALSRDKPVDTRLDRYEVDLAQDRRYGSTRSGRWTGLGGVPPVDLPDMTLQDESSLCYTSEPLNEDTEVTGHPIVHLFVSSTLKDSDFFVFLEDVGPDGTPLLVTEGQLRASWAGLHDCNGMTDGDIEIKPKLPWHGFEERHWQPDILAGGRIVELVIDLQPVSWLFRAGHRFRLAVTGANWPEFRLHPYLSPSNDPYDEDNAAAEISVYRGGEFASFVKLPIIPR